MMIRKLMVVALAVAGMLAAVPSVASAHPGPPSDVFDPDSVGWASIRNYGPAAFNAAVNNYQDTDFIAVDMDADTSGASYVLSGVFQRNLDNRNWDIGHGLTEVQYVDFRADCIADGMRMADYETFVLAGTRYHNLLCVENVEGYAWVNMRNMSEADWLAFRAGQHAAGRIIVDFDHYPFGGGTAYSAISVRNAENLSWEVEYNLSLATFQDVVEEYYDNDFRLLLAESTTTAAGQRFSGVFVRNVNGRGAPAQGELTSAGFSDVWGDLAEAGNRLITQERYETAAGTRYLGVWRQND